MATMSERPACPTCGAPADRVVVDPAVDDSWDSPHGAPNATVSL